MEFYYKHFMWCASVNSQVFRLLKASFTVLHTANPVEMAVQGKEWEQTVQNEALQIV